MQAKGRARTRVLIFGTLLLMGCPEIEFRDPRPTAPPLPTHIETSTPQAVITRIPPTPEKVVCSGPQKALDGAGGFLWKNGDSSGKVVVLLPGRFKQADRVTVYGAKRNKPENLSFSGFGNPDSSGDRQHWRGLKSVKAYKGKVEVYTGKESCTYAFKNSSRVD